MGVSIWLNVDRCGCWECWDVVIRVATWGKGGGYVENGVVGIQESSDCGIVMCDG